MRVLEDLQLSGASLAEILLAGEWKSRVRMLWLAADQCASTWCPRVQAVARYVDPARLECDIALEAAMHSDNEEWVQ